MGYRASVITQHREYGANIFSNWDKFQTYVSLLRDMYEEDMDNMFENDQEDFYEVPKSVFEAEIKRLKKLPGDTVVEGLDEEAQYVITDLETALKEAVASDDYVALEWF